MEPQESMRAREVREDPAAGRNQDIPLQPPPPQSPTAERGQKCSRCDGDTPWRRNLVVMFDGTANQFGDKNTNVTEFYSRIVWSDDQLLYYNSGIGTLPAPASSVKEAINKYLDLAFARTFNERVMDAYKWLSNVFERGDRVYIYGFSRGAYQARTLAAMIGKVGLIRRGHESQIPFAYQIYLESEKNGGARAKNFKRTFSRDVPIHFIGAWDTVSSIGVVREQRPGASVMDNISCYVRHALALDERRVKFQPELVRGGESIPPDEQEVDELGIARVKEVYFAGSHSDIGGGNVNNLELNNAAIPLQWMVNQSLIAGLRVDPSQVKWDMVKLAVMRPDESMTLPYRIIEFFPIKQLTYKSPTGTARGWHRSAGRIIKPGQRVHASLCFIQGSYIPNAKFHPDIACTGIKWEDIVGVGMLDNMKWVKGIEHILEMDLFDISGVPDMIQRYMDESDPMEWGERLEFLASIREGAQALMMADETPNLLRKMMGVNPERTCTVIRGLVRYDNEKSMELLPRVVEVMHQLILDSDVIERVWFAQALWELVEKYGELPLTFLYVSCDRAKGDTPWDAMIQSPWIRHAILATLYFGSFLSVNYQQGLAKAEELLRGIPKLSAQPSLPTDSQRASIQNSLATILEARGTTDALRQAVEIRLELMNRDPDEYYFDLTYALLHFSTLALNDRHGKKIDSPAVMSTRSRAASIKKKELELAKCLTNLANRYYDLEFRGDAFSVAAKSVKLFREITANTADPDIATSLNNFSNRLGNEGRYEEALEAIEEAVGMRRILVNQDPITYRPDLATSLINLSRRHWKLGNREESLKASEEAVKICRGLSAGDRVELDDLLASSLHALTTAQSHLGRLESALRSIQEAVRLRESLAKEQPETFNHDLASSLNSLSNCHSSLGQREDALAAITRAVKLNEALAKDRPAVFTTDLAMSLNNLSLCHSNLGHREDALAAIKRAVKLREALARDRPAVFNPDLAMSLINLSLHHSSLGQHGDALAAITHAVDLCETLVKDRPLAFDPVLAMSLNNLSHCHSNLGRFEDALTAIKRAVALRETLAKDQPTVFNPVLAHSLNHLSSCHSDLGQHEDALATVKRAVGLYEVLAKNRAMMFNPDLAASLNKLSACHSALGQREDALAASKRAVELDEALAKDRPAVFNPDLATSLGNLSLRHSALGQLEDALAAIKRATELYESLAKDQPVMFNPGLAAFLNTLSNCHSNIGQHEYALAVIKRAVALREVLAEDRPTMFNPHLAESLNNLSLRYSALGQHEDAVLAIKRAVGLYEALAKDQPAMFNPNLATSLNNLSSCHSTLGRYEDALATIKRAVGLYEALATDRPDVYDPDFAMSLNKLSLRHSALGHHEDALAAIKRAVELYEPLVKGRPAVFNPDLARSLNDLSSCHSKLGQHEDALAAIKDAVALREVLAKDRPAAFNPDLAMSLNNLSLCHSRLGQHQDALAAIKRAVELYEALIMDRPAMFNPYFAGSLYNLSRRFSDLCRHGEALVPAQDSLALYRDLARERPAVFTNDVLTGFRYLAHCLSVLGREDEADKALKEADELEGLGRGEQSDEHQSTSSDEGEASNGNQAANFDAAEDKELIGEGEEE